MSEVEERSVATLRALSLDQVQQAQSGHIGLPLGAAPILHNLYGHFIASDPADPTWINRDRFVLSAGHGSALLYSALHLAGYAVTTADLQAFRQWGSITPGHPETGLTPGVDATTGPLGQGITNAVGMAIAESMGRARLAAEGGPLIDHRTFVLASDGDLMEGVALEAAALAGLLELGRLIVFYDDNDVVIDGRASAVHSPDATCESFRAHGWQVLTVTDGNDLAQLKRATEEALADSRHPSLIRVKTVIGFASPLADLPKSHSGAFSVQDEATTRSNLLGAAPFEVSADVRSWWERFATRGAAARAEWLDAVAAAPEAAATLTSWLNNDLPDEFDQALASFPVLEGGEAARLTSGRILQTVEPLVTGLVGGAADLAAATMASLPEGGDYSPSNRAGRNLRFGIREHAMSAIVNGIALHGLFRPFGSTFLAFSTYQSNSLRMAALQELPVIHVFSHDSITVGEDGPTHQPIEMLAALRATPNTVVLRPADAHETVESWRIALSRHHGPSLLVLSRIALPVLDRSDSFGSVSQGGYIVTGASNPTPDLVFVSSGSEVSICLEAAALLTTDGIDARVVSMPSFELFNQQDADYREAVTPAAAPRLVVEASHPSGLWQVAGPRGQVYGIDRFGASAPPVKMLEEYGFTPAAIAQRVRELLGA